MGNREEERAIEEYRGKNMSTMQKAELELQERLKKQRQPLRAPTYDEERYKKNRRTDRKLVRIKQKQLQKESLGEQPKTTQSKLIPQPTICKGCDQWVECCGSHVEECEADDQAARDEAEAKALQEQEEQDELDELDAEERRQKWESAVE